MAKRIEELEQTVADLHGRYAVLVASNLRRNAAKLTSRVSLHGGYSMAISRNITHVGAIGLIKTLHLPVRRQTVARWERLFAINIMKQYRGFFADAMRSCCSAPDTEESAPTSWSIVNVRGDATNSNVTSHSGKAFVCMITCLYRDASGVMVKRQVHPPLQQQPVHCYGETVRNMLENQMLLVGLPSWTWTGPPSHVRGFLFLSDSGPDEVSADHIIKAELAVMPLSTHSRSSDCWLGLAQALRLLGGTGDVCECVQKRREPHPCKDGVAALVR